MHKTVKWLLAPFAWRIVADTFVHVYEENKLTGRRRIRKVRHAHQPIDAAWLKTGRFTDYSRCIVPSPGGILPPHFKT